MTPRAEVIIGFAPEDREIIQRMLDAQDHDAEVASLERAVQDAQDKATVASRRGAEYERMWGAAMTRMRQLEQRLDNVRLLAHAQENEANAGLTPEQIIERIREV